MNNADDFYSDPGVPVSIKIDGTLDLHQFAPRDIGLLIPDYLDECQKAGMAHVRIVHGKGQGVLRRSVHAILQRLPIVESYHQADESAGSWGATMVTLKMQPQCRA